MKRTNDLQPSIHVQLELDNRSMVFQEKNGFQPFQKEKMNLRDFISLLKTSLARDELISIGKELIEEIEKRTSVVCQMIPVDIWKSIFCLLAHKKDISCVFPLKQVCKTWKQCFSDSISEATILKSQSIYQLEPLSSLRSLKIKKAIITPQILQNVFTRLNTLVITHKEVKNNAEVSRKMWTLMTNLRSLDISEVEYTDESFLINSKNIGLLTNLRILKLTNGISSLKVDNLKHLIHLKELDLRWEDHAPLSQRKFEKRYGQNLELLNSLKELEVITLYSYDFLNYYALQEKYPYLRFRWLLTTDEDEDEDEIYGCFEGDFSKDNLPVKGVLDKLYTSDDKYQGEFKNKKMDGKGVLTMINGNKYEGNFKDDMREGMGTQYYFDGKKYTGEFKNDKREGKGKTVYSNGSWHEGEYKNDIREGKGNFFYSKGDRFEGEYFRNFMQGKGVFYYNNGNRYVGEFNKGKKEGEGKFYYANGNRYEGNFKNNNREGSGIFFYSNGDKFEGNAAHFDISENGILKMLV